MLANVAPLGSNATTVWLPGCGSTLRVIISAFPSKRECALVTHVYRDRATKHPGIRRSLLRTPDVASCAIHVKATFGRQCPSNHSPYLRYTDNALRNSLHQKP